jgi:two-component system OmpR family response regulator
MQRVLVLDNDPDLSELITRILQRGGYQARTVSTAAEALDDIRRNRPAAVLVNLGMPAMEGWRFLRDCTADPRCEQVPTAAMSPDLDEIRLAHSLGASDRLVKPFGLSAVLQVVDGMTCAVERLGAA